MTAPSITTTSRIARSEHQIEASTGEEIVLMHVDDGRFFSLAGTGRRVWELLDEPRTIDALVAALREEFAVDQATCERDVIALCDQLAAKNLVDVSA